MARQTSKRMRKVVYRDLINIGKIQKDITFLLNDLNSDMKRRKKRKSYKKLKKHYKTYNAALKTWQKHVLKMYRRIV